MNLLSLISLVLTTLFVNHGALANSEVRFGRDTFLTPVDETTLTPEERVLHEDRAKTGALLFDSTGIEDVRLSTNVPVESFKSRKSKYFRADPTMIRCLQKTFNYVYAEHAKQLTILSGFKTTQETPDRTGKYAMSGTGASLGFLDGTTGSDILSIAQGVVRGCSQIFAIENRDLGLIIDNDAAFIYMTGADDVEPHFESHNSAKPNRDFPEWCREVLDVSLDPKRFPTCNEYPSLVENELYPDFVDEEEEAIGSLDTPITRQDKQDFGRLMQYPGRNMIFEDSESGSTWCGTEGNACIDCSSGIKGQALASRCADRTMSPRMYNRLNVLQKLVRVATNEADKLKVLDAWDEPHSASPDGDHKNTLHTEGRAAKVVLNGNPGQLEQLSKLAICAGFDFVQRRSDHIYVAVRKQARLESHDIAYSNAILTAIAPPYIQKSKYQVPQELSRVADQFPLFDSDNMENVPLTDNSRLGQFKGSERYMRIIPAMAGCYDALFRQENKWNPDISVNVVKGFQSREALGDMEYDPRGYHHLLGHAIQVNYGNTNDDFTDHTNHYSVDRLVKSAVDACSQVLQRRGFSLGLGLYSDGLYIDARDEFDLWAEDAYIVPGNVTVTEYKEEMYSRTQFALENRVVNPSTPIQVCEREVPPRMQDYSLRFRHEHHVQLKRQRRSAGEETDESCNPTRNTPFCAETKPHRQTEITHVWTEVLRKHLWHDKEEVKEALEKCLGECGTCPMGHIYEDKLEHCTNFLHWVPFDLMNDEPDRTNFYSRSNLHTRRQACHGKRQCVSKAPLYALITPSLDTLYRPDPQRSVQEELYSANDNPMPVYQILHKIFAMHAKGEVFVWVKDQAEIRELYHPLKVIFIYNRNVTDVQIYVEDEDTIPEVDQAVNMMLEEWVTSSCPLNSRATTSPFTISNFPSEIVKRSIENDFGEQLLEKRKYWERDWLRSTSIM